MFGVPSKKIVIFDLDGTLADDRHRNHYLHPKHPESCHGNEESLYTWREGGCYNCGVKRDWDSYFKAAGGDHPKPATIEICNSLSRWYHICILSGRSESTRAVTAEWLDKYEVNYHSMILRAVDDRTQDDKLKLKWVEEMGIADRILCIFEDRQRVVDAWRAAGYTCFQVAPGNF